MEDEIDLFEQYETLPQPVQDILTESFDENYEECEKMLKSRTSLLNLYINATFVMFECVNSQAITTIYTKNKP